MDYILYFAITILILVFVHELGHFTAAKLMKMRVDIFAIGFGKRLLGWNKKSGFSFGELPKDFDGEGNTDYRISILPLGGYVKIAGMIDESMDTNFAKSTPKPDEFRSKSTFAKIFVITAGVLMNVLLSLVIFSGMNYFQGRNLLKTTTIGKVYEKTLAYNSGFVTGDKILAINNEEVYTWDAVQRALLIDNLGEEIRVDIQRGDKRTFVELNGKVIADSSTKGFFLQYAPSEPIIAAVMEQSPAAVAGLLPGDIFKTVNGVEINYVSEARDIISKNIGQKVNIEVLRNNEIVSLTVQPNESGVIGINIADRYSGEIEKLQYSVFESFSLGISDVGRYSFTALNMFKMVFQGNVSFDKVFGGPVKIAQYAADSADLGIASFLSFLALISLSLAILNILPFPVLDGGHLVIIIIEGILRKELPLKFKIAVQNTGFAVLMALMILVLYLDILSLF